MKIVNFGSLNLDYSYSVERFVSPGETMSAVSMSVSPGGKGLNQSIALARAGAKVYHAGLLGQGGEPLKRRLEQEGVNLRFLRLTEAPQGNAIIQVDPSGENCILLYGGSNRLVSDSQILETLEAFEEGDLLLLQNEISGLPLLLKEAGRRGLRILLNPSPFDGSIARLDLSVLSWLIVNRVEAAQLAGTEEPEQVWEKLHREYPELSLILTLGSRGSFAWESTSEGVECCFQKAFSVNALDSTGAGDTFTGYFAAGLAEGLPLGTRMELAAAAAAISVTRRGAADSIPSRAETEAFLARQ